MILKTISETKTIWFTFGLTIALTLCFGIVMLAWDFTIIDEIHDAKQIVNHIAGMSPKQKQVHAWMTATLDVIYPFSYASFFIGATVKAFPGNTGLWLATPILLCVPADLLEGYSQVMLLNDHTEYMTLKTVATPIKLLLFITGMLIAIASVARIVKGNKDPKVRYE